jgi:hypothetical protein
MKIILDIVNNVIYKDAKFYYNVIYIVGYIKIIKFINLKIYYSHMQACHFCVLRNKIN